MAIWNPWHGCRKISPGCLNCYVYRRDAEFGKDSSIVEKTASFDLPLKRNRKKEYKLQPEEEPVYTCMTSDFFLEQADAWRSEAWKMIRHKQIIHEPMLQRIQIEEYLKTGQIEQVICGGESGDDARVCDYAWILDTWKQCVEADVSFHFKQTGANFKRGNRVYHIERKDQMSQAAKAGIDYIGSRRN